MQLLLLQILNKSETSSSWARTDMTGLWEYSVKTINVLKGPTLTVILKLRLTNGFLLTHLIEFIIGTFTAASDFPGVYFREYDNAIITGHKTISDFQSSGRRIALLIATLKKTLQSCFSAHSLFSLSQCVSAGACGPVPAASRCSCQHNDEGLHYANASWFYTPIFKLVTQAGPG